LQSPDFSISSHCLTPMQAHLRPSLGVSKQLKVSDTECVKTSNSTMVSVRRAARISPSMMVVCGEPEAQAATPFYAWKDKPQNPRPSALNLLACVREGDAAARKRSVLVGEARRVSDFELRRSRMGVATIQEPTGAKRVSRADLRHAAPHPIVVGEADRRGGDVNHGLADHCKAHALMNLVWTLNSPAPPP
jgi:hypothetical protein